MKKHKLTGQGGKGSARRNSNEQAYADNWDKIFGTKTKPEFWDKDIEEKDKDETIHTKNTSG